MGIKRQSPGKWQVFSETGVGAGYKLHTYTPGTTDNKLTHTNAAGSADNTNPVIFDARGEADIWFNGTYDLKLVDENDALIWTLSDFGAGEDTINYGNFNVVKDGGFEDDTDGDTLPDQWDVTVYPDAGSGIGVAILDTTDQIEGAQSLKFTSVGDGGGYAVSAFFEVGEGDILSASWLMKSTAADVRNVVEIIWYTAAQVQISTSSLYDDSATNPTGWTSKSNTATVPSTARYGKIRMIGCHSSDATSGSTWFDNVLIVTGLGSMSLQDADSVAITGGTAILDNLFLDPVDTGGSVNAYTATLGETAYTVNRVYTILPHADNTGATTINLDGLGAKSIKMPNGGDLDLGALQSGRASFIIYGGTNMFLLNPLAINTPMITDSAVSTDKVADLAITAGKIATNTITSTQLGPNSVGTSELGSGVVTNAEIASNTINAGNIAANAVGESEIAANAVHTSELNRQTPNDQNSSIAASGFWRPSIVGSSWSFGYQVYASNSSVNYTAADNALATSLQDRVISLQNTHTTTSYTGYLRSFYMASSPPYDLGYGNIETFVFLLIDNATKNIEATYTSDDAPWHYAGKTDIRPSGKMADGTPYKNMTRTERDSFIAGNTSKQLFLAEKAKGKAALELFLDNINNDEIIQVPIDQAFKNKDMADIPHPFINTHFNSDMTPKSMAGKSFVVVNPHCDLLKRITGLRQKLSDTDDFVIADEFFYSGMVSVSNTPIAGNGGFHPSVKCVDVVLK